MLHILLVEDNLADAHLMHETFEIIGVRPKVAHVQNGTEALDTLRKRGKHKDAPTPDLIILDLNLPKKNGREVIAQIRRLEKCKNIPIAVLSNSRLPADVEIGKAFERCQYFNKPANFTEFVDIVKQIMEFGSGPPPRSADMPA